MPFGEDHRLTFAWETFNVTNTQRLGGRNFQRTPNLEWNTLQDPNVSSAPPEFGNILYTQGKPRVMQFSLRYDF